MLLNTFSKKPKKMPRKTSTKESFVTKAFHWLHTADPLISLLAIFNLTINLAIVFEILLILEMFFVIKSLV